MPFWALMSFTVVLLLSPQTFLPELARLRIALLTGGLAVAAHCWTQVTHRRPLIRFTREVWIAVALLGWAALSLPLSTAVGGDSQAQSPGAGSDAPLVLTELSSGPVPTPQALRSLFPRSMLVFWLLGSTITTLDRLRTAVWGLSLMATPLAATGVVNLILKRMIAGRIVGFCDPPALCAALTGDPGDLALMLNLILPLMAALLRVTRRPAARGLLIGLMVLNAAAIVATFSRTGFVTLLVSLVLSLRALPRKRAWKWVAAALALALVAVPLLPSGYVDRLATIAHVAGDPTGSSQERARDMQIAMEFALSHPLVGAGLGNNILVLNQLRGPMWQPVHNVYLEYAVDLGWPGLALFILLLGGCLRHAGRIARRSGGDPALHELSALAGGIWISLVAFTVSALAYPVAYHLYFYYFAGLAVAVGAVYEAGLPTPALTAAPR